MASDFKCLIDSGLKPKIERIFDEMETESGNDACRSHKSNSHKNSKRHRDYRSRQRSRSRSQSYGKTVKRSKSNKSVPQICSNISDKKDKNEENKATDLVSRKNVVNTEFTESLPRTSLGIKTEKRGRSYSRERENLRSNATKCLKRERSKSSQRDSLDSKKECTESAMKNGPADQPDFLKHEKLSFYNFLQPEMKIENNNTGNYIHKQIPPAKKDVNTIEKVMVKKSNQSSGSHLEIDTDILKDSTNLLKEISRNKNLQSTVIRSPSPVNRIDKYTRDNDNCSWSSVSPGSIHCKSMNSPEESFQEEIGYLNENKIRMSSKTLTRR